MLGAAALLALVGPATAVVRNVINAVVFRGARITMRPESIGSILRSFAVDQHFHFASKSSPQRCVDEKDSCRLYALETDPERTFSVHGAMLGQLVAWYTHEPTTTPGQRRTMSDLLSPHPTTAFHPEFNGILRGGHVAEASVADSAAFAFTNPRMTFFGPPDSIDELHRMAESVTTR